jgi:hypothetical protein
LFIGHFSYFFPVFWYYKRMFDEYSPFTPQLLAGSNFVGKTAELTNMRHYEIIRLSQAGGGRRRAPFYRHYPVSGQGFRRPADFLKGTDLIE